MAVQIQVRRGDASLWTSTNPILAEGEIGAELDTGRFKIGDGTTAWNSLGYSLDLEIGTIIGSRTYTEQNYVTDSESVTASIDALDVGVAAHLAESVSKVVMITEPYNQLTTTSVELGFKPKSIEIYSAILSTKYESEGFSDRDTQSVRYRRVSNDGKSIISGSSIRFDYDLSNYIVGATTYTVNGLNIAWSSLGSLTGATGNRRLIIVARNHGEG